MKPGETLAQIAERVYGDPKLESVLVGANALDVQGGTVIVPGMRLEVPAPGHHTVMQGETWADLALSWLGAERHRARPSSSRARTSGVPWVPPVEGQEIEIPAVVTYIAGDGETVNTIAARFWGDPTRGWELNRVQPPRGRDRAPRRGRPRADAGSSSSPRREEPRRALAAERDGASGGMAARTAAASADAELPQLLADVRYGRYAEAIARGNRLLGGGALTHPQLAIVHRALLEAYVAIDARPAAAAACAAWRSNDPRRVLDPVRVSPKILAACEGR